MNQKVKHGITFEVNGKSKHTWLDWSIVPTEKPVFQLPESKEIFVEIPGMDGMLDVSKALTGQMNYGQRTGTFEFMFAKGRDIEKRKSEISNFLHGENVKVIFDDDIEYYYTGLAKVSEIVYGEKYSYITIEVIAEPYKLKKNKTIIQKTISRTSTFSLPNLKKTVIPKITSNASLNLTFKNSTFGIQAGESIIPEFKLGQGDNEVTVKGNGTITFEYQEGGF